MRGAMRMSRLQSKVETSKLSDFTEEQAKTKGKIFHQAWKEYTNAKIAKNREKIKQRLDSKHKM